MNMQSLLYNHILKLSNILSEYSSFLGHIEEARVYNKGPNQIFQSVKKNGHLLQSGIFL